MFLHVSVSHSVQGGVHGQRGEGMHAQGACMPGGHACPGRMCAQGVCVPGGHAWPGGHACPGGMPGMNAPPQA